MQTVAPNTALVLDRFRSAFTDLLCSEETESVVHCHENSRLLYRLVLAKESALPTRDRSSQRRFLVQIANIYLDQAFQRSHVFTRLLDHIEAHPSVAQVVVSNLLEENRSWLNGFLLARGYQDKTTHCVKTL